MRTGGKENKLDHLKSKLSSRLSKKNISNSSIVHKAYKSNGTIHGSQVDESIAKYWCWCCNLCQMISLSEFGTLNFILAAHLMYTNWIPPHAIHAYTNWLLTWISQFIGWICYHKILCCGQQILLALHLEPEKKNWSTRRNSKNGRN